MEEFPRKWIGIKRRRNSCRLKRKKGRLEEVEELSEDTERKMKMSSRDSHSQVWSDVLTASLI